ncbi:MAG: potassium transporter TrkG, partial [Pseudomonadota bacterium]
MRVRPVLLSVGVMTALLGAAMIPCALIDIIDRSPQWPVFAISAFLSILAGAILTILSRGDAKETGQREAFFLTVLVWVVLPLVAAFPIAASGASITDAVFESVSGLTTTGATVLTALEDSPRGLLLWRGILQWYGGIGIIVTAIAILPSLRVGGMQLFQLESSDQSGKFLPRVTEIATQTGFVYLALSVACGFLYALSGMKGFDAVVHAMTTVSAGGYSTTDLSFQEAASASKNVAIVFMILASLPFAAFVLMARGQPRALWGDPQARLLLAIIVAATVGLLIYNGVGPGGAVFENGGDAVQSTLFNVVAVITGTGYASENYAAWGDGATSIFIMLMFFGGCAGSAACGFKMFRLEISAKA